jgi:hypothetical protein
VRALLLAVLLAPSAVSAADRSPLALLPATGSNVDAARLAAATDILRAYLESTGRFVVVRARSPRADGEEPGAVDAAIAARDAGTPVAVTLRVSRLQHTALARLAAYRQDGALVHSDELGALGPDDLDPVLRRLAEGLARGGRGRDLAQIDTVTLREAQPLPRRPASGAAGLRLGGLVPMRRADPERRSGVISGIGLAGLWDARSWFAEVAFDAYVSDLDFSSNPERSFVLSTSVYLPFTRGDVAPYAGGGLGFGYSKLGGSEGGSGLSARASAGLLMGRLSDASFRAEWGLFWNFYDEVERGTGEPIRGYGATFSIVVQGSTSGR